MLTESQAAFEIGLWGPAKARSFLANLLARFGGNVTKAMGAAEAPIHDPSEAEVAANNKAAVEEWNKPDAESLHEKAVNYIFAHNGCLSKHVREALDLSKNQWAYTLQKLGEDPRLRKTGDRRSLRWHKA